jgi:hypothetical protein
MRQRLRNPGFLPGSGFFSGARERTTYECFSGAGATRALLMFIGGEMAKAFFLAQVPFVGNHHRVGAIRAVRP